MSALAPSGSFGVLAAPRIRRGETVLLLGVGVLLFTGSALATRAGHLPMALHVLVASAALVLGMVVAHDAIHSAAHGNVWVNRAIGWLASVACGVPFVVLASNHLRHHRHVGTDEDPERFCLGPVWQLPFRGPAMLFFYYVETWPRLDAKARRSVVRFVALEVLAVVLAPSLVGLWLAPLALAAFLFATFTVWLPHGPWADRVMKVAPFLTGYHDDHHARPAVPSLQYGELHRWHRAAGVTTRHAPASTPAEAGRTLAQRLLSAPAGRALRVDEALQATTVRVLGEGALAGRLLSLRRKEGLLGRAAAGLLPESLTGDLDLILASCVRQLSLHPRVRARVEAELDAGSRGLLCAVVREAARLERGDNVMVFDPSRWSSTPALSAEDTLAVEVLASLLSQVRLDVRTGSPVKGGRGLEVRVARRAAAAASATLA